MGMGDGLGRMLLPQIGGTQIGQAPGEQSQSYVQSTFAPGGTCLWTRSEWVSGGCRSRSGCESSPFLPLVLALASIRHSHSAPHPSFHHAPPAGIQATSTRSAPPETQRTMSDANPGLGKFGQARSSMPALPKPPMSTHAAPIHSHPQACPVPVRRRAAHLLCLATKLDR